MVLAVGHELPDPTLPDEGPIERVRRRALRQMGFRLTLALPLRGIDHRDVQRELHMLAITELRLLRADLSDRLLGRPREDRARGPETQLAESWPNDAPHHLIEGIHRRRHANRLPDRERPQRAQDCRSA